MTTEEQEPLRMGLDEDAGTKTIWPRIRGAGTKQDGPERASRGNRNLDSPD